MKKFFKYVFAYSTGMLLFGCGAESEDDNSDEITAQDDQVESGEEVELRLFLPQPRFREHYEAMLDNFQEDYYEETGIQVTFQVEMPGGNEAPQILQARLNSNDAPDVFLLHAINELPVFHRAGYVEDLSDLSFVENTLEAPLEIVTIEESVYAAPLESLYWGYLYNVDIFDEYEIEVPMTIDEMEEVVNTLNENGVTPFVRSYQELYIPQLYISLVVGGLVETENTDFFERMNSGEGSFAELNNFFTAMDLANENGTDRPFEVDGDQGSNIFANEEAAMWVQGPWMAESILNTNENINFSVAPLPINNNPDATMINAAASTSLAVSSDSDYKDISKDLVNYFLDSEKSSEFFESVLFNPVTTNHNYETFPWVEEAMTYVENGQFYQDPPIPNAVKDESMRVFQEYLAGSVDEDYVIESLDREWEQSVD